MRQTNIYKALSKYHCFMIGVK